MSALFESGRRRDAGFRDVDPAAVRAALGTVRIIDVRERAELTGELGHVPGAELVLVCRSGGRSAAAAAVLATHGFVHVMNMAGGMLSWREVKSTNRA